MIESGPAAARGRRLIAAGAIIICGQEREMLVTIVNIAG
jgi:hypothetical protein